MPRALCMIRPLPHYRRDAFEAGLRATGYKLVPALSDPKPDDLLVIWNRQGSNQTLAKQFTAAGAKVLVAENGYMGKRWIDREWFAISRDHHNGAGRWPAGGPERWDNWGVELKPWRESGTEVVLLPQRGIGEPGVAMPLNWTKDTLAVLATRFARVRQHPGDKEGVPLETDLRNASSVVTWASGAAIKAIAMGIPCFYSFPKWIGAPAARPLADYRNGPLRDDAARLAMFRRLAWAMWTLEEIQSGVAIGALTELV